MPRQLRIKGEYNTYHITQRGNEKKDIFLSDEDRLRYLSILNNMKSKYDFIIEAYCLMNNHVHLLIYDNGKDVSQIIKSINISYVYYFNSKYERVGHLFQERFGSEIIKDDKYLLAASAYIHNNPVRAGFVKYPQDYLWSSAKRYFGLSGNAHGLVRMERIMSTISNNIKNAAGMYYEYVMKELIHEQIRFIDFDSDEDFKYKENIKYISNALNAKKYLNGKLAESGITMEEMQSNKAFRNGIINHLRENSNMSLQEIGNVVGGLSFSTISRILKKMNK